LEACQTPRRKADPQGFGQFPEGFDLAGLGAALDLADVNGMKASSTKNMMSLTLAGGYIKRLVENNRVLRYLRDHHADVLAESEGIAAAEAV